VIAAEEVRLKREERRPMRMSATRRASSIMDARSWERARVVWETQMETKSPVFIAKSESTVEIAMMASRKAKGERIGMGDANNCDDRSESTLGSDVME
jgi:hypothetical protein